MFKMAWTKKYESKSGTFYDHAVEYLCRGSYKGYQAYTLIANTVAKVKFISYTTI